MAGTWNEDVARQRIPPTPRGKATLLGENAETVAAADAAESAHHPLRCCTAVWVSRRPQNCTPHPGPTRLGDDPHSEITRLTGQRGNLRWVGPHQRTAR